MPDERSRETKWIEAGVVWTRSGARSYSSAAEIMAFSSIVDVEGFNWSEH
jgi:hypothetical protein